MRSGDRFDLLGELQRKAFSGHRSVRESGGTAPPHFAHEMFGLDVMIDDQGKCWLLECNNSPGLEYCDSHFPDGERDPTAAESDAVTWSVINDRFKLLGIDGCSKGDASNYLRVV